MSAPVSIHIKGSQVEITHGIHSITFNQEVVKTSLAQLPITPLNNRQAAFPNTLDLSLSYRFTQLVQLNRAWRSTDQAIAQYTRHPDFLRGRLHGVREVKREELMRMIEEGCELSRSEVETELRLSTNRLFEEAPKLVTPTLFLRGRMNDREFRKDIDQRVQGIAYLDGKLNESKTRDPYAYELGIKEGIVSMREAEFCQLLFYVYNKKKSGE